jgi:hypothetical protein
MHPLDPMNRHPPVDEREVTAALGGTRTRWAGEHR